MSKIWIIAMVLLLCIVQNGQSAIVSRSHATHVSAEMGPQPKTAYYRSPVVSSSTKCTVCHP
jgi:hypothetical protein